MFREQGHPPLCLTRRGCPARDVAPDRALDRMARAFLQAERLEASPGAARFQEAVYRDSGLLGETPDTLLALKDALHEHRERRARRDNKQV